MAAISRGLSRLVVKNQLCRAFSVSQAVCHPESPTVDSPTHTGQEWEKDDYRRARFAGKTKHVNKNFAIDLIDADPIVVCNKTRVSSNSGGALGHPKVFINLDKPEVGVCGYSGRKFIYEKYYKQQEHGPSITYTQYLQEMKDIKS